jgi:hypothetical protein
MFGLFRKTKAPTAQRSPTAHSRAIDDWIKSESKNRAAQVPQQKGLPAPSYFEHQERR